MKHWTAAELEFLRRHYPDKGAACVAEATGRGHHAVHQKAAKLGLRCSAVIRLRAEGNRQTAKKRPAHAPRPATPKPGSAEDILARFRAAPPAERALIIAMAKERAR